MNLGIYLVTDRHLCGARGVVETVRQAVEAGAGTIQLRDKAASISEHLDQVEALATAIDGRTVFVVNDRLDVVLAARERGIPVDGVHVGQSDDAVLTARELLGPDAIVGLTANTPQHLDAVCALPAGTVDYVGIGVIRPTSTKPNHPPALGFDGFGALARVSPVPTVAIGGVTFGDMSRLRHEGADGVAVVSAICGAPDAAEATRALVAEWNSAH
ncbi:thiamine phosphate synthase [Neomicrococcus aestuarii]|uniref:Thiamine-phosphate synthase n=1 Tax=Neomicrococcus aestuarii TaxID=556325 RepID=A0A1L2ZP00_9MICC|nr:thiamine phosphate synthase [Neomicrococcus aestuarii]APF41153.1 thiamine-phosphate diphosphorylase [Neomicrococcus aestuarii]